VFATQQRTHLAINWFESIDDLDCVWVTNCDCLGSNAKHGGVVLPVQLIVLMSMTQPRMHQSPKVRQRCQERTGDFLQPVPVTIVDDMEKKQERDNYSCGLRGICILREQDHFAANTGGSLG
jgi:hypothetical protein